MRSFLPSCNSGFIMPVQVEVQGCGTGLQGPDVGWTNQGNTNKAVGEEPDKRTPTTKEKMCTFKRLSDDTEIFEVRAPAHLTFQDENLKLPPPSTLEMPPLAVENPTDSEKKSSNKWRILPSKASTEAKHVYSNTEVTAAGTPKVEAASCPSMASSSTPSVKCTNTRASNRRVPNTNTNTTASTTKPANRKAPAELVKKLGNRKQVAAPKQKKGKVGNTKQNKVLPS
jgi:hypothetical protein